MLLSSGGFIVLHIQPDQLQVKLCAQIEAEGTTINACPLAKALDFISTYLVVSQEVRKRRALFSTRATISRILEKYSTHPLKLKAPSNSTRIQQKILSIYQNRQRNLTLNPSA